MNKLLHKEQPGIVYNLFTMAEHKDILAETENSVCTLTLNRPEKRNSLTRETLELMRDEVRRLEKNPDVRCLVITGAGDRAFCSGYDIGAISGEEYDGGDHPLTEAMEAVRNHPLPVIAMINGHAFGAGLELAVACDIRVCADDAKLAIPPAKLGVTYGREGIRKFLALAGPGLTRELFLTGNPIDARRAEEKGLVNHAVKRKDLVEFTYSLARGISENAPLSMISLKKTINILETGKPLSEEDEETVMSLARKVRESADSEEGKRAFAEKRKPVFRGR